MLAPSFIGRYETKNEDANNNRKIKKGEPIERKNAQFCCYQPIKVRCSMAVHPVTMLAQGWCLLCFEVLRIMWRWDTSFERKKLEKGTQEVPVCRPDGSLMVLGQAGIFFGWATSKGTDMSLLLRRSSERERQGEKKGADGGGKLYRCPLVIFTTVSI